MCVRVPLQNRLPAMTVPANERLVTAGWSPPGWAPWWSAYDGSVAIPNE